MSQKSGRNDPCPCGSGKKYKKCCLAKDTESARNRPPPPRTHQPSPAASVFAQAIRSWAPPTVAYDAIEFDDDDLDALSNHIVDLIHNGQLDDAERACDTLERQFPDMIDCLDRRAMVLQARGQNKLAAGYYRRAAEYARIHEGFEPESIDYYLDSANKLDPPLDTPNS
jgi:tetratricopeptide (TPR) repeat protein